MCNKCSCEKCSCNTPSFDPSKPVQTRDGRKARLLDTNGKYGSRKCSVAAAVQYNDSNNNEHIYYYDANGRLGGANSETPHDLVNVLERHSLFMNIYSQAYQSKGNKFTPITNSLGTSMKGCETAHGYAADTIELVYEDNKLIEVKIANHRDV